MSQPRAAIAGTFVQPRGSIRSQITDITGGAVLGVIAASAVAERGVDGASPLPEGQLAYLAVLPDSVMLFTAKKGAFKPKPTDSVIATAPRSATQTARVQKQKLAGILEITFADGSTWSFDVPRVHLKNADRVATALGSPTA
jgi:hypothetical protein